mgnify:FL=1
MLLKSAEEHKRVVLRRLEPVYGVVGQVLIVVAQRVERVAATCESQVRLLVEVDGKWLEGSY